eukprot:gene17787-biopygen15937
MFTSASTQHKYMCTQHAFSPPRAAAPAVPSPACLGRTQTVCGGGGGDDRLTSVYLRGGACAYGKDAQVAPHPLHPESSGQSTGRTTA